MIIVAGDTVGAVDNRQQKQQTTPATQLRMSTLT